MLYIYSQRKSMIVSLLLLSAFICNIIKQRTFYYLSFKILNNVHVDRTLFILNLSKLRFWEMIIFYYLLINILWVFRFDENNPIKMIRISWNMDSNWNLIILLILIIYHVNIFTIYLITQNNALLLAYFLILSHSNPPCRLILNFRSSNATVFMVHLIQRWAF